MMTLYCGGGAEEDRGAGEVGQDEGRREQRNGQRRSQDPNALPVYTADAIAGTLTLHHADD